jgi:hypothetical protein
MNECMCIYMKMFIINLAHKKKKKKHVIQTHNDFLNTRKKINVKINK